MSTIFEVLAEPNRRRIVELLRGQPLSVGEIVDALGMSQPSVSKHLRVLKDAGVVGVQPDAQRRLYFLRPEPMMELDAWLLPYRTMWEDKFDRLEALLREEQERDSDSESAPSHRRSTDPSDEGNVTRG